jgi:hypothetical protein
MGKGVRWKMVWEMGKNKNQLGGGESEVARCNFMDIIEVPPSKNTFEHSVKFTLKESENYASAE